MLGKGIEMAFVKKVLREYKGGIKAEYIPTAKNGQVADFYERVGMRKCGDGMYEAKIEDLDLTIKEYCTIE